jgi:sugar/nucleoside kinase (ribokinase family)
VRLPAREGDTVSVLAVVGNISRDLAIYPDGSQFELLGGAALHVARSAARAGLTSALISVIGADLDWIRSDPRLADLDLTHVKVVSRPSCAFRLTYAAGGRLAGIDCSYGAAESTADHFLTAIGHSDQYHVCCRRPLDIRPVLGHLANARLKFSADFHLASADELICAAAPFLLQATAVFVNEAEFAILRALIDPARIAAVVITDGPREATLLRYGRAATTVRPPRTFAVEVTGAGDILAGTFLASVTHGLSDNEALQAAVSAATQSVTAPGLAIPGK